ncbi:hypothetical protein [Nocardia sp. NPDC050710]|uniref:hypothetical protein n=1 Tax=Nocardia sp. NPDC050710 TaxID=3157220 RepID=UPI0033F0A930
MKKLSTLAFIGAAAAGLMIGGAGLAAADQVVDRTPVIAPGEPNPNGTGSAAVLPELVKALSTGSAQKPTK